MANAYSIPKSTIESYIKLDCAKQLGLKALIVIADGLDVLLDWLVRRIPGNVSIRLTINDFALRYYSGILRT